MKTNEVSTEGSPNKLVKGGEREERIREGGKHKE